MKYSVYILEENKELANTIYKNLLLLKNYEIKGVSDNAESCIEYFSYNNCNLLIIDLMLSKIDGISVLQRLKKINKNAYEDVTYCMKSPVNIYSFLSTINSIMSIDDKKINSSKISEQYKKIKLENEISMILKKVGIPVHIKGYMYLRTAILLVYYDIEYLGQITRKLYPDIARQYSTTASRVEKSIRHAIKIAWNQDNGTEINNMLRTDSNKNESKPTNSEFIALIADNLRIQDRLNEVI